MRRPETAVSAAMFAIFVVCTAMAWQYPDNARLVPLVVSVPATLLAASQLARDLTVSAAAPAKVGARHLSIGEAAVWLTVIVLLLLVAGFVVGGTVAVMLCQRIWLRESWRAAAIGGAAAAGLMLLFDRAIGLVLFEGWVMAWM